jgi:hypothetical protein
MAKKRMYSNAVTDSDAFIEMSSAAQALYFHLNQGADDDGFNNQIQLAMLKAHASTDDLKILMAKNFVIRFESGVIVIKHWRLHNTLRKDRYTPTNYQEELRLLGIKENGVYTLGCQTVAERLPNGCPSIDKNRLVEIREVEDREEVATDINVGHKPTRHKYGMYENVLLTDEEYQKLQEEFPHDYTERIERLSEYIASTGKKYKSHLATIRAWARKDTVQRPANRKGGNVFLEIAQEEGIV